MRQEQQLLRAMQNHILPEQLVLARLHGTQATETRFLDFFKTCGDKGFRPFGRRRTADDDRDGDPYSASRLVGEAGGLEYSSS
jgi:hypothetical protein